MSTHERFLDQVCELLALLPGTTVLSSRFTDASAQIEVRVDDATTLDSLQHEVAAANLRLDPWLRPSAMKTAVFPLHCSVTASHAPIEGLTFGYLQILGIHLVWRLHRLGLLTTAQANPRLRAWNAACVCDWPAVADPE